MSGIVLYRVFNREEGVYVNNLLYTKPEPAWRCIITTVKVDDSISEDDLEIHRFSAKRIHTW